MKVALVNPGTITSGEPSIPHGPLHLSAMLKSAGHKCRIFDFSGGIEKISYQTLSQYDLVGLSVMSTQLGHAAEIARNAPAGMRFVWGGVHCLLDPLSVLNEFKTHFVISGEGEAPLLDLIEFLIDNKDREWLRARPGICFYDGEQPVVNAPYFSKDINDYPDVNYYDLPLLEKYIHAHDFYFRKTIPSLNTIVARGCLWDCSFCINSIFRKYKARHRCKTIAKIRAETEKVIDDFKVKIVVPRDDDFFANRELVEQWKEYATEKNFLWGANCRFNYINGKMVTEERLRDLAAHGMYCLGMSIEAGDEAVRNGVINKRIKDSDIVRAAEIIKRSVGDRVIVNTSFIIDFPGDTRKSRIGIIKWMKYLTETINIVFSGPQPYRSYPGSKLYECETTQSHGALEYYLNNITPGGEFKTSKRAGYETYFYSNILKGHYNRRTKFFELTEDESGKVGWEISREARRSLKRRLLDAIMETLFFTIKLRLKLNFWFLFVEPSLLAAPKKMIDRMRGIEG